MQTKTKEEGETVIIHDHTQGLLLLLQDDYEEQIKKLQEEAQKQAENIIEEAKNKAENQATQIIRTANEQRKAKSEQERTAAEYAHKKTLEQAQEQLLEKGLELVTKNIEQINEQQKKKLIKKMLTELKGAIRTQGYNEKTFTYHAWQGYNDKEVKNDLKELAIKATAATISFEDGIKERLKEQEAQIKQQLNKALAE